MSFNLNPFRWANFIKRMIGLRSYQHKAGKAINRYECPKGHFMITKSLHPGYTPHELKCTHPDCKEKMTGFGFMVEQDQEYTHVWIKPSRDGMNRYKKKSKAAYNAFARGWLQLRTVEQYAKNFKQK